MVKIYLLPDEGSFQEFLSIAAAAVVVPKIKFLSSQIIKMMLTAT